MAKILAIVCAKGGVGKTTTTINLASALHFFARDVIIVDADLTAPNMSIHLGVPKVQHSIHDALEGKIDINAALYFHPSGLRMVPGHIGYEASKLTSFNNFPEVIGKLRGKAEIVLLDGAPGVNEDAQKIIQAADYVMIVTTPDLAAVSDARKTVKMTKEGGKELLGVIINRARGEEHELSKENVETFLEVPVLGIVPEDDDIRIAYQYKGPLPYIKPESGSTTAYKRIAAKIIGEEYDPTLNKREDPSIVKGIISGWLHK